MESTHLALSFAYSLSFSCMRGPSLCRNSSTARFVSACSRGSCRPSRALRYRRHVSSSGGIGSDGSSPWRANVRDSGGLASKRVTGLDADPIEGGASSSEGVWMGRAANRVVERRQVERIERREEEGEKVCETVRSGELYGEPRREAKCGVMRGKRSKRQAVSSTLSRLRSPAQSVSPQGIPNGTPRRPLPDSAPNLVYRGRARRQ